jgi:hypothetical protein
MGDYDWFSDSAIEVATEGLREEATKWHGLADRMITVSTQAADQGLKPSAFMILVDGTLGLGLTEDLHDSYQGMYDWLNLLFKQAVTEFDAMGNALKKNADWYEHADATSTQNFDSIATS